MASMVTCIITSVVTSVTWCFCTAITSLFGACCGNDKLSTQPPGMLSGRRRSVFLLLLSICCSLIYQYPIAKIFIQDITVQDIVITDFFQKTWLDGCEEYMNPNDNSANIIDDSTQLALQQRCVGNNGNFRVGFCVTLFYLLAGITVLMKPTFNREVWPAKIILFLFMVAASAFVPSEPYFSQIYMNIARVGGVLFILLQQIIIIDVGYNWNDSWVEKSNKAEKDEGAGAGNKWLYAIILSCTLLFGGAILGIVLLFIFYTGCTSNNLFISLTLFFCIAATSAQMSGENGNLLTSACISAWAVFLCYSGVSKNPNESCNPRLADSDVITVFIGMCMTVLSLSWAAWSWTAEDKFQSQQSDDSDHIASDPTYTNHDAENNSSKGREVTGVVTGAVGNTTVESTDTAENIDSNKLSNSWKLNFALGLVSCWSSMVLTDWGAIQADGTIANASTGQTAMWMIMATQWIVMTLYTWTLVAPRLFPGREFS